MNAIVQAVSCETRQWFVGQASRNKITAAWKSVAEFGFEAYLPLIQRQLRIGHRLIDVEAPRFGNYVFVKFDRDNDDWGVLCRRERGQQSFTRFLCNASGRPVPVPDGIIQDIKMFKPPIRKADEPIIFVPGERVVWVKAGRRTQAVFNGYCGNRPFIRVYILGAERVAEVSSQEIEPLDVDIQRNVTTNAAP